jgi:SAM-dependent methyltransferase
MKCRTRCFTAPPRLVTHIDESACAALSAYYARTLRDGDRILDLMSSCVSHLPTPLAPERVIGHGMNATELEANPQLDEYFLQNLNKTPMLPLEDASFNACLIAVSVQYLVEPAAVFTEIGRILTPGGLVAVSFSNRMFPTKAVAIWRMTGDTGHGRLVADYVNNAQCFEDVTITDISPSPGRTDPLFIVTARKT